MNHLLVIWHHLSVLHVIHAILQESVSDVLKFRLILNLAFGEGLTALLLLALRLATRITIILRGIVKHTGLIYSYFLLTTDLKTDPLN